MASDIFIVIPAFNEAEAVGEVVRSLRRSWSCVVVVDDGSTDETAGQAEASGAIVVRHMMNRGQGAALQTGIAYSLLRGASVIVTFDADGQHRPEDVATLVNALKDRSADIAIGSRFLGAAGNVPAFRRLLLRLATLFMRITSQVPLTDAHNGLRAMTARTARTIRITLDGMAHASEIVDQIHLHGLRVVEVPVVIRYSEYSRRKGQSAFAAFRIAFDYLLKRWLK